MNDELSDGSKELVTANVGDARVILVRGGQAIQLTVDHKVIFLLYNFSNLLYCIEKLKCYCCIAAGCEGGEDAH